MKPRLRTTREQIRTVAERWRAQYMIPRNGWSSAGGIDKEEVYDRLRALDVEACSEEDVTRAIWPQPTYNTKPYSGWTSFTCDACGRENLSAAVEAGQEPDYESRTVTLCRACAEEVFAAFDCRTHEDCAEHPSSLGRACAASQTQDVGDGT